MKKKVAIKEQVTCVKRKIKVHSRIAYVVLLTLLFAYSAHGNEVRLDWKVSIAAPAFYPVKVTKGFGVNEENDWTSPLHEFSQFMRVTALDNIVNRFPSYDGFGVPIHNETMLRSRQVVPESQLPEKIYLFWTSLANNRFYATEFIVSVKVKKYVLDTRSYVRGDGAIIEDCNTDEIVFGLLPNGNAKVYLRGCGELIYVTELLPSEILEKDGNGFGVEEYLQSSYFSRIHRRAEDAGATIDPIPWDKVNRVYANQEIKTLN
ncbi:DUF2931 family protein [Vibrio paucivorans]